ncbi:hypothetical protein FS837_008727 [Tulasnella sp. UAMH 9824]|nr:hypothetical protein FS837_008727 [Tulasnella sp. UAMH 9824]
MHADYMQCTGLSILQAPTPLPGHRIRPAEANDVDVAAKFCRDYSSYPYSLDEGAARREARALIDKKALFFYEVGNATEGYSATSIVAVGRSSMNVASITKVFTLTDSRRMGYASRLLHHVCSHLLNEEDKSAVVSLVPSGNEGYKRLAMRIGFGRTTSGNNEWLEMGFEDVNVGHW